MSALPTDEISPRGYKEIPTVENSSLLRQVLAMRKDLLGMVTSLEKRYGQVWRSPLGEGGGVINLLGPDALELVLKNRDGVFSSARGWKFFIGRVFPGAIMAMDGDEHRYQRRIMQVAFRKSALKTYLEQMSPAIERDIEQWLQQDAATRKVFPLLKQLTLNLAASVFMGVQLGSDAAKLNRAFVATVAAPLAIIRKPIPPFAMWRGIRGRKVLVKRFRELIAAKRATHTSDFFSEFCHVQSEQGEKFTDQEIIDHMIFLMMAAHDTTTSTLTSMMYLLARHPDWQERLRAHSRALGTKQLAFDDLDKLEELNWVIRETLRMYPPLTSMPRMCMRDTEFNGYLIPAGAVIGVFPIHAHYDAALWSDPKRFDPERFSPARQEDKSHPFAWAPFGGGAHICIGQHFAMLQVKAIMHQLLLTYRWSVPSNYTMPAQMVPIIKPRDGLPVRLDRI
jgi:cytochrome P450